MKTPDQYISLLPNDPLVRSQISYYYFHSSLDENFKRAFIFYPHFKNAITAYRNCEVVISEKGSDVRKGDNNGIRVLYTRKQKTPSQVKIDGPFQKIGIIFKPLGLNYFLSTPLSEVSRKPVVDFTAFGDTFQALLEEVFLTEDPDKKVALLDTYFSDQWRGFKEDRLLKAVDLIFAEKGKITMNELANELDVSEKTAYRLFKKHLCCSVQDYKSLVRFRSALNTYESYLKKPKLVELAYESDYYDQAEFVNHFRSITGFNPKKFLSGISKFGKQDTFWTVLE